MRNSETKLQKQIRKEGIKQKMFVDSKDTDTINAMFNALLKLDSQTALNLIKKPNLIIGLIDGTHNFKCLYALHAIVITLISSNCADILNDMSDENIATLKKCISIAKKYDQQDVKTLNDQIAQRKKKTKGLSAEEQLENRHMIQALCIAAKVNDGLFWADSIKELNKWSTAIDNFVRTPRPQKKPEIQTPKQKSSEYWTIKQLAQQLGGEKEYNIRNHITPYLKGKKTGPISDWFVSKDGKIVFKSEHLSEYKAALDERKGKTTQPTQKPIQLKNMLDVKAFIALVKALQKQEEQMFQKLKSAKEAVEHLRDKIANETNDNELTKLLDSAVARNKEYMEIKKEYYSLSQRHQQAVQLHQEYMAAEQKFKDTQSAVKSFMITEQINTKD